MEKLKVYYLLKDVGGIPAGTTARYGLTSDGRVEFEFKDRVFFIRENAPDFGGTVGIKEIEGYSFLFQFVPILPMNSDGYKAGRIDIQTRITSDEESKEFIDRLHALMSEFNFEDLN